uniref:Uncharacterized protein n=1 Tax=Anguilla anguilla TaxID=7936 RepID=A0A0E9WJD4_ANGAN
MFYYLFIYFNQVCVKLYCVTCFHLRHQVFCYNINNNRRTVSNLNDTILKMPTDK